MDTAAGCYPRPHPHSSVPTAPVLQVERGSGQVSRPASHLGPSCSLTTLVPSSPVPSLDSLEERSGPYSTVVGRP